MNGRCCQAQQPHGVEKSNKVNYTNRNSTGSTNSSQTSSGFESSKVATTQGGRSSAYFSLSDGLDLSSTGIGEVESGTLTTILKKGERSSKTERARRGNCSRVNIGEMLAKGIPEQEIFAEWLQRLCLSKYLALFLSQGYDLPTLARATPEDLTTLGITKPDDRKCLVQDIQCWQNVADNWPTDITKEAPTRDWLTAIGLKQYIQQFERQGCLTMGMKFSSNITERNNNNNEEAETAFMNVEEDFPVGSARLIMNGRCCQAQQPHGVEKSNKVNYTNRNSTGSTNSSQTSSGFESSKV
uniref:SAM domain-containing protein n=1 Tax=Meloidogyne floridensis TaxID=298350 RepID=A0A915NSK7_9BILA